MLKLVHKPSKGTSAILIWDFGGDLPTNMMGFGDFPGSFHRNLNKKMWKKCGKTIHCHTIFSDIYV